MWDVAIRYAFLLQSSSHNLDIFQVSSCVSWKRVSWKNKGPNHRKPHKLKLRNTFNKTPPSSGQLKGCWNWNIQKGIPEAQKVWTRNSLPRALEEYHRRLANVAPVRTAQDTYICICTNVYTRASFLFLRLHGQCCMVQRSLLRLIQFFQVTGWRVLKILAASVG